MKTQNKQTIAIVAEQIEKLSLSDGRIEEIQATIMKIWYDINHQNIVIMLIKTGTIIEICLRPSKSSQKSHHRQIPGIYGPKSQSVSRMHSVMYYLSRQNAIGMYADRRQLILLKFSLITNRFYMR